MLKNSTVALRKLCDELGDYGENAWKEVHKYSLKRIKVDKAYLFLDVDFGTVYGGALKRCPFYLCMLFFPLCEVIIWPTL